MKRNFFYAVLLTGFVAALLMTSCVDLDTNNEDYAAREARILKEYLDTAVRRGFNVDTTKLGVYYITRRPGTGAFPVKGDSLAVKYFGFLMDGSIFDASQFHAADSLYRFVYMEKQTIAGWEEMMGLMNQGSKVEFIIPSNLAYGATGTIGIPSYSTLVFVAEMRKVKSN